VAWKNAVDANNVAPPLTSARLVPSFWRPSPFSRSKDDEAEEVAEGGENSANLLRSFRLVVVVIVLLALPAKEEEEEEEEEENRALLAVILSAVVLVIVVVVVMCIFLAFPGRYFISTARFAFFQTTTRI
jgi:hypothetical protein